MNMKNIKVRFKANISGYKTGDIAEVNEDLIRRAGDDVEIVESGYQYKDKKVKVSNKAMTTKQVKIKKIKSDNVDAYKI